MKRLSLWPFGAVMMPIIVILAYLYWNGLETAWPDVLYAVLPIALVSGAILHPRKTGKVCAWTYVCEIMFPYFWIAGCTFAGKMPYSTIIVFLTLPVAIACAKTMKNSIKGGPAMIADLDERTANLQFMFAALFSIAFLVSKAFGA